MSRKSLKVLFEEIDYSNIVERYLRGGYKIMDQYKQMYPQNFIADKDKIEVFLAEYMHKLGLYGEIKFDDSSEIIVEGFYNLSMMALEKKYPIRVEPPDPELLRYLPKYDWSRPKYSYKTEKFIIKIITTGVYGGLCRILEDLVILNAEDHGERAICHKVNNFYDNLSSIDEMILVSKEYIDNYSQYLPSQNNISTSLLENYYLKDILIEHPKMMHRMKYSLKRKGDKGTFGGYQGVVEP